MQLGNEWKNINHAYISSASDVEDIWHMLGENLSYYKKGNPDALELVLETFGVDESRALYDWSIRKPFAGGKSDGRKVAVISAISITTEAQNALLKLFEEPAPHTHFFLMVPSSRMLLSTLLSRVQILQSAELPVGKKGEEFLRGNISERFKIIAPIVKSKDKSRARQLLYDLTRLSKSEKVLEAERYLAGRSPSIKMILEYLAVTMVQSNKINNK
jgi:DNA polymerase III delta prime subunit